MNWTIGKNAVKRQNRVGKAAILLSAAALIGFAAVCGRSQVPDCPPGYVCLTRAAAQAALEAGDKAKALQTEVDTLKTQTIPQLKDALADMRVQYAECKGESTILKQRAVSDAAMIELLSKLVRPKKFGIINF